MIAYLSGRYLPLADAGVPLEDRGLQFADALYEVCAVLNGRLLDWPRHLARLRHGLAELAFPPTPSDAALGLIARRLLRLNRARDALLYLQVSRGVARRDHLFPRTARPTLAVTVRPFDFRRRVGQQATGVAVLTQPDRRWARPELKTTGLLPNLLAKQAASEAGAFEAWLVAADGTVREGGSTNAWIVDADGRVRTHPRSPHILAGIMRDTLLDLARSDGITIGEETFTLAEARAAREAFLTSTTAPCLPVVRIDGARVGDGRPGPVAARLARLLWAEIERQTGWRAFPAEASTGPA